MSKIENSIPWLKAYQEGKSLEQSRDNINWFDLSHEPSVGDDWFYREKIEEHQCNDDFPSHIK